MTIEISKAAAAAALFGFVLAAAIAEEPVPGDGPGWTGVGQVEDVILARQALMNEMERLMQPIDSLTVGEPADAEDLRSAAQTIAQMLLAFPHLFPPTTNLYDENSQTPVTIALPAIWDNFETFYALVAVASTEADAMSAISGEDGLAAGGRNLRAACDACHTLFLRPYVPSSVTQEDRDFDFDALFGGGDAETSEPPTSR